MVLEEGVHKEAGAKDQCEENEGGVPTPPDKAGTVDGGNHNAESGQCGDEGWPRANSVEKPPEAVEFMGPGPLGAGVVERGEDLDVQSRGQEGDRGGQQEGDKPEQVHQPEGAVADRGSLKGSGFRVQGLLSVRHLKLYSLYSGSLAR